MRKPLVFLLSGLLGLMVALPTVASAADPTTTLAQAAPGAVKKFESKEQNLYFEYPAAWKVAPPEPRGVLKNEIMNVKVTPGTPTSFLVAVYKLDAPVDMNNPEATEAYFDQLNADITDWVTKLPGGSMQDASDISVDDVDGWEFSYDYDQGGTLIHADMILLPKDDKMFEVTQWAKDDDYDTQSDAFDDIFSSLRLPWTPPS